MKRDKFQTELAKQVRRHEGVPAPSINTIVPEPMSESEALRLARELGIPISDTAPLVHIGFNLWEIAVVIEPEVALNWLTERNPQNRDPAESEVKLLVSDLDKGSWVLTHQGIAFGRDGKLKDGQHRLAALVYAGRAAVLKITLNVPTQAVQVMDTHRKRRAKDAYRFMGEEFSSLKEAVVKRAIIGISRSSVAVSNTDVYEFVEVYRNALDWVFARFEKEDGSGTVKVSRVTTGPVLAALLRAFYHTRGTDRDRLADMCKVLITGVTDSGDLDQAAILYRDWLRAPSRVSRRGARQFEIFGKGTRAIKAFLEGESLKTLVVPSRDIYPLPDIHAIPSE